MLPVTTQRLTLRRFEERDLGAFAAYRNKPEVARYQSWTSFSRADAQTFYAGQRELLFNVDDTWIQIAAIRHEDQEMVGDVAVHFFDSGQQAEIGFTLDSVYQSQGYAVEAVSRIVQLLFVDLNKHRVVATTDADNTAAHKLLDKIGFRREAHHRKNILFKGAWSDECVFALLQNEWRARTTGTDNGLTG